MVTGFESSFYNDISHISGYLQSIASELTTIRKMLEAKKWEKWKL